jgi:hypothetical protein
LKELVVTVGGTKAKALMLDETAPKTCDAIWNHLPLVGDLHYAKIANTHEVFFMAPFVLPQEGKSAVSGLEPGSMIYWPKRQFICIFFGPTEEVEEATLFAKITEGLPSISKECMKILRKQGASMTLRRVSKA